MDYQRHREGIWVGLPSAVLVAALIGLTEAISGPVYRWMGFATLGFWAYFS